MTVRMRRLFILLAVLVGFAVQPAGALAPAPAAQAVHGLHHDMDHDGAAPAAADHGDGHQCLGCAAPYAKLPAVVSPQPIAAAAPYLRALEPLRGTSLRPETPPPRPA